MRMNKVRGEIFLRPLISWKLYDKDHIEKQFTLECDTHSDELDLREGT